MMLDDKILGARAGKWRFFALAFALMMTLLFLLILLMRLLVERLPSANVLIATLNEGNFESAPAIFFMLLAIGSAHLAMAFSIGLVYRRRYRSVICPVPGGVRFDFKMAALFFLVTLFMSEILMRIVHFQTEGDLVWQIQKWLIWLLPVGVSVLLQTSAEEVFFRGFLQQYLARLVPNRWAYIVLPSAIWAWLHYGNVEGFWLNAANLLAVFIMGLILADWAQRRGSLIAPITIHFLNNFLLIQFFGNTIEPSELHIYRSDLSMISDQILALYTIGSSGIMLGLYLWLRDRIAPHRRAS